MRRRIGIAVAALVLATTGLVTGTGPAGAADAHTVTVTPSTGLRNGQTVTVSGTGFTEAPVTNGWAVAECSPAAVSDPLSLQEAVNHCDLDPPYSSAVAESDGTLSTQLTLRETLVTPSGSVTCGQAPNDCFVLVGSVTRTGFVGAVTPISFGPPVPTLADCIRTFLADHQHRPWVKISRLLVCIWTAVARQPH